jgi:hypothetical protein
MIDNPDFGNSDRECCEVSNNWRLVGAIRGVEFKLA